jgi:DNA-binding NtrC family response regulator
MTEGLRVLVVADKSCDVSLIESALARTIPKASVRWARTREGFVRELADFSPQLILSDDQLPDFGGLSALALVKQKAPETQFILISGGGEEMGLEALKGGATDYVLKKQLERLAFVLTRALQDRRIGRSASRPRRPCSRAKPSSCIPRKWKRWGACPGASPTTSTTS